MSEILLKAENIHRSFPQGHERLHVLKGLHLEIKSKEALCIIGSSGAGKSTLLQILGTLDKPTEGILSYQNQNLLNLTEDQLAAFRNKKMGFVFQFHNLLAEFTAIENVMLPCRIAGETEKTARAKSEELLKYLGILHRAKHYPTELSGGELQRVSIARALANSPEILFADEPTGNLDTQNGKLVQDLFLGLRAHLNVTLVVVTHDIGFANRFDRTLHMRDGLWI